MDPPHVHCLVTGGGLATHPAGVPPEWRGPKQAQYLFPVVAVAAMFRGKFLAGLKALRAEGKLGLNVHAETIAVAIAGQNRESVRGCKVRSPAFRRLGAGKYEGFKTPDALELGDV